MISLSDVCTLLIFTTKHDSFIPHHNILERTEFMFSFKIKDKQSNVVSKKWKKMLDVHSYSSHFNKIVRIYLLMNFIDID